LHQNADGKKKFFSFAFLYHCTEPSKCILFLDIITNPADNILFSEDQGMVMVVISVRKYLLTQSLTPGLYEVLQMWRYLFGTYPSKSTKRNGTVLYQRLVAYLYLQYSML
jgi:hypothetical protein